MSIVAAENAGLGPCELPDHWPSPLSTSATKSSTSTAQSGAIALNNSTSFVTLSKAGSSTTNSTYTSCSAAATGIGSTSNNTCNLPRSSPTAATAAVTVSNAASTVLGLAPVVPTSAGFVPHPNTIDSVGSAGGGGGAVATSPTIANHRSETTTTDSISAVLPSAAANVLARLSTLQQHQQQQQHNIFLSNNNSLLNNSNNLLPLHLQHHHQQYPSLHKAASTAANIAAALQRSANMNAVASPISANSTSSSNRKIRRKNDSKANLPQSQINKCNNEKRRRELENNYIEQLSEFLQLNKRGDMTSTKPDKAAILNQVVKTYRDICDRGQGRDISSSSSVTAATGTKTSQSNSNTSLPIANSANSSITNNNNKNQNTSTRCSRCATDNCSIHPVQQGEVSSTEPPLPEPSLLNGQVPEISAYFEALEHYISSVGWVLLQVNSAGIIESCTQNIRELIGYEKQELCRQPLYMYLYPGDHTKLDPIISNMSSSSLSVGHSGSGCGNDVNSVWSIGCDTEDHNSNCNKQVRSNSTKVRMLVKDVRLTTQTSGSSTTTNNDSSISMEQTPKYEEVVVMAAPVKDDSDSSSVLCLITRPEDESPLEMNIQQHVQHPTIEQVTFKLDIHGKIITLDATTLREPFKIHLSQWSGRLLQDLCHPQDLSVLKAHLRDIQDSTSGLNAVNASQSPGSGVGTNPPISNVTSKPFRLRLGAPDVYVHVKANSRLFVNNTPGESDFIMSVQTLLNTENDMNSNNTGMMAGNCGLVTPGMASMSPGSSLVSSLVSNLSMDSFINNNSSHLVNVSGLGGLVGGGGMPPHTTQTTNVGGPLMTSAVINGTGNVGNATVGGGAVSVNNSSSMSSQRTGYINAATGGTANNSALINSFTASPAGHEGPSFYSNEFDLDLPHSSFEIDPSVSAWNDSRPNSRASVTTPVSTPRPPSAGHGFSPAVCPSPSTPYQLSSHSAASMPSPQSNASQSGVGVSGGSGSFGFGFPSFDSNNEKIDKDNLNNNNSSSNNNNMSSGSGVNITGNLSNGVNQLMLGSGVPSVLATNPHHQNQAQQQHQNTKPPTESERLRHLLTNKTHSTGSASIHGSDGEDNKYYKQDEDKESLQSNMFKMAQGAIGQGSMGTSRMFGIQKPANSNNPMLLSLLKSEDDEKGGSSMGRSGDMVRIKDENHGSHGSSHNNPNNLSPEDLRRILKHQGDPAMTRKRSLNDPDDGLSAKRSDDRPSKLCETNKMLARLLRNPPKNITMNIQTGIKIIPDKVPAAVGRVSSTLSGLSNTSSCSSSISGGMTSMSNKSSTITTTVGSGSSTSSARGRGQHKQTLQQLQQPSDVYLTQQQQVLNPLPGGTILQRPPQTHQQSRGQMEFSSSSSSSTVDHPFTTPPLNTTAPSKTATSTSSSAIGAPLACLGDGDSELSKILDSVMDYVTDDQTFTPTTATGLTQQQINERLAISEIQKSLMVETSAFRNGPNVMIGNQTAQQMLQQQIQQNQQHSQLQPPAYPGSMMAGTCLSSSSMTPQQLQQQQMQMMRMQQMLETMRANQNFQRPPPNYPARGRAPPMNAVATPGGGVISATHRYRTLAQQQIVQQQKERLLQQQQKQHMLVPENATARNDQLCLSPNIGTLLNTVAPNVTLSRTNMPPDSQLSPNFAQNMLQQQLSPGQRNASFSPQSNPGYGQQYSQSGQRLSPQQQQQQSAQQQQQQIAFQSGNAAQLSPRQPLFSNQGSNTSGNAGIPSPGITQNASPQQWPPQASANPQQRGHSLQQHNPMLSAQLQGVSPYNSRQYQQQRGRSLNSPIPTGPGVQSGSQGHTTASLQRQNSFQTNDSGGFASTTQNSTSPQSPYSTGNVFQQNQQQQMQRMQRQTSIPQATQHLPAGNPASSDYVKQELRAVVSGRAAAAASSGGSGNGPGGVGIASGLRVATPQSPHGLQTPQGPMLGANSTNSMAMAHQQQQTQTSISSGNSSNNSTVGSTAASSAVGNINSGLLNTPPDSAIAFGFDAQDFFGSTSTR